MSEIRRDSKGRVLRENESQDKNGRYLYKYWDAFGKRKTIYSWKLTNTDTIPKGKRDDISLREKVKMLQKDLNDGIGFNGNNMTVLNLVEKYISQKRGVRYNTQAVYNFVMNIIKEEKFGQKRIDSVRLSDAKQLLIKLQDDGRGYSTIRAVRSVVKPAFQMAVDDDLIRKNPFSFALNTVVVNDSVTREAITKKQENEFLKFIKKDKYYSRYYEGMFILFKTGLRISEFCGLTLEDIDLNRNTINVDHQLQKKKNMEYMIEPTKTVSGRRVIPMTSEVAECFKRIIENRKKPKVEPLIDGKHDFLYLDKNDMPMVAFHWENYFHNACVKYNKTNKVPIPKITPHVCRHTYASNMSKSGMNPKILQTLMGHSNIGVTLNIYTHVNLEDVQNEVRKIGNK